MWLNADIVPGPGSILGTVASPKLVDGDVFLSLFKEHFPEATLSPGWGTGAPQNPDEDMYTQGARSKPHLSTVHQNIVLFREIDI